MKMLLFVATGIMLSGMALAEEDFTFTLGVNDAISASGYVGETCSANGNKVIACKCASGQTAHMPTDVYDCVVGGTMVRGWGCKFTGSYDGTEFFCSRAWGDNICSICGCYESVRGEWQTAAGNKVSRSINSNIEDGPFDEGFRCSVSQTFEYGCAANYYTDASSPSASMTCKACPSSDGGSGLSVIGNTSITGCYIPKNMTLNDVAGNYIYTSNCYYSK